MMTRDENRQERVEDRHLPRAGWKTVTYLVVCGLLLALMILLAKGPPIAGDEGHRVLFTEADVAQVRARFARTWNRQPTGIELRQAFEQHVREEVLFREALARDLDLGDPTVRLAMVRKINLLGSTQAESAEPTDDELLAYFTLRQERYRIPAVVSLRQVYLNPDRRGDAWQVDAARILTALREREPRPEDLPELGDALMVPNECEAMSEQELDRMFGNGFGAAVLALEPGEWEGPIESGYGWHLARITRLEPSRLPEWREIRERIAGDMQYDARQAAEDLFFSEVVTRYQVMYDDAAAAALEDVAP